MNRVLVVVGIWLLATVACGSSPASADGSSTPDDAAAAFEAGDVVGAVSGYERMLVESGPHPDVYYNLGVARLAAGRLPEAVLALERSLALEPGRDDAERELELARTTLHETVLSSSTDRGVTRGEPRDLALWRLFRALGTELPAWVLLGTWLLAFGGLIGRRWIARQAVRDAVLVTVLLAASVAVVAGGYLVGQWYTDDVRPGIIVDGASGLSESPTELAETHSADDLYAGATVLVLDDRGDWLKVALMDGSQGWLPRSSVSEVRVDRWPEKDVDSSP